jgi:hypothetical protein
VQRVGEAKPAVLLVVQPFALNAFAVGVVRKAVNVEIESAVGGRRRPGRAERQRRSEDR